MLLNLLEASSAVTSCCLAITALSNQLTTSKQLIGKEGSSFFLYVVVVILPHVMYCYAGGIGSLVKLLNHEDVQCKSKAVQALASLVTALPSNCKLVHELIT